MSFLFTFFVSKNADLIVLGQGLRQLRESLPEHQLETMNLNEFLDPFNRGRIGIRLLTGQHVALERGAPPDHIGLVAPKCNIQQVLKSASDAAR